MKSIKNVCSFSAVILFTFGPWCNTVSFSHTCSKSPRIRTYFFESQAEIGSIFKGTKTKFKVQRFLLKGASRSPLKSLTKMFSPIICFGSVPMKLISNWGGE